MRNFRDDGIAAVIPARAGSKRIPNKNFRVIDGQPAVARIIDKLVSTNLFDKIIVHDLQNGNGLTSTCNRGHCSDSAILIVHDFQDLLISKIR